MRPRSLAAVVLCAIALLHATASAQALPPPHPPRPKHLNSSMRPTAQARAEGGKVIRAIRVVTPPAVDGRLGDEVWTLAPVATGFMQRDPITDSR